MTIAIRRVAVLFAALSLPSASGALAQDVLPDAPAVPPKLAVPPAACPGNFSAALSGSLCCQPSTTAFQRFIDSAASHPLTPREKLLLAGRNIIDPFNLLTIVGTSAINVASDPDTAYGPGLKGFGRNSGVVFTEGLTGEFLGTFLIPSIMGQDPHYHRMPNASTRRRIAHAIYQTVWTQSDSGRPMFNYATVFGTIAGDAINDLYVPGRKLGPGSSAKRIGTAIGTVPLDNFITEFVPDVARRVKFRVVLMQRIVDRVALEEGRNASD
ncbi:MAG TPA: hypothetical protein VGD59_13770 [Acidisarcina sp.]